LEASGTAWNIQHSLLDGTDDTSPELRSDVKELQGLLSKDGFVVERDGIFGRETESAVRLGPGRVPATRCKAPLSKQHNKHLQTTLIEAAKMAPRNSPELAMLYDKEKQRGNANRAALAVARKLVAYLMAVDRGQRNFQVLETSNCIAA